MTLLLVAAVVVTAVWCVAHWRVAHEYRKHVEIWKGIADDWQQLYRNAARLAEDNADLVDQIIDGALKENDR